MRLVKLTEGGVRFETGRPVSFSFVRNTAKSPYLGAQFQQDIEPAGVYMLHGYDVDRLLPGWVGGEITFRSPLVLSFSDPPDDLAPLYGPWSWKGALAHHFGGKKGRALSRALVKAGFDGIVTAWCPTKRGCGTREIVSLAPFVR